MRLRRDLPLTVLVDLLLQILFILALLFAVSAGSDETAEGNEKPPSNESLLRDIARFKSEIAALRDENSELRRQLAVKQSSEPLTQENAGLRDENSGLRRQLAVTQSSESLARGPGAQVCREDSDPKDPPAGLHFEYQMANQFRVTPGPFFNRMVTISAIHSPPEELPLSGVEQHLQPFLTHSERSRCVFRAKLSVPGGLTSLEQYRVRRVLDKYFRVTVIPDGR